MLTALALAAALAVAWGLLRLLLWLAPGDVPRLGDAALLDVRVLAFGAAATFATAVLCALWPVLVARRVDVLSVLAHGASVASDPRGRRVQRAVVVAQVATAVALLFGTALFLRTVRGLDATVLGFDPERLLAFAGGPGHRGRRALERVHGSTDRARRGAAERALGGGGAGAAAEGPHRLGQPAGVPGPAGRRIRRRGA